jgi:putative salt-induced outer membrane protein
VTVLPRLLAAAPLLVAAALGAQPAPAKKPGTFEGSASLGFSQTRGNADATTINVANKLKYAVVGWQVQQDLTFFYGEAEGKVNANFWNGGLRAQRGLGSRVGAYLVGRFDRNVLQGISRRFEEGVGLDITAVSTSAQALTLALGVSQFQQVLTPGSTSAFDGSFPAARAALDFRHKFSANATFQQTAEYLPNLSESSAYLVNTESILVAPLMSRLAIKVGYVIRYNSTPPVRNNVPLRTTDTFFSSGVTYSF